MQIHGNTVQNITIIVTVVQFFYKIHQNKRFLAILFCAIIETYYNMCTSVQYIFYIVRIVTY